MKRFLLSLCLLLIGSVSNAQITVTDYQSTGTVNNLASALDVIAGNNLDSSVTVDTSFLNYHDGAGDEGNFTGDVDFPNQGAGAENFTVRATGTVIIPTAGDWTFGTNADDGLRLIVDGSTVILDDALHAPEDRFGTINLGVGSYDFELIFFEHTGIAALEFFAAQGSLSSFDASFRLVGDVGSGGLQVVPEPSTYALLALSSLAGLFFYRRKLNFA